ncbi:MAG TPA: aldehyde dehydrogenase (NADP(+)) [Acidobacteriota bacterium]|nr:aldehyde dehydrogenase (NADP(+)) [Acidobacteriota bacterium]
MGDRAEHVLVAGEWRPANASDTFQAINPDTGETLPHVYPVSDRSDVDATVTAGAEAARTLTATEPERIAAFLDGYAHRIDAAKDEIAAAASLETALPVSPRLADVELPRTTDQLRQAAAAARNDGWRQPTIDTTNNIRSMLGPLGGPVAVFGPNNFPLAFNGASGGDFAAAIATGNPVIVKAHPSHPRTTQLLTEATVPALQEAGLPAAMVQMIYRTSHDDGAYFVSHPRIAATGYTGSRAAGLALKEAADRAGKPIYLELSSINPVFVLPGALRERREALAEEFVGSALLGTGQFCTNPGVVVVQAGDDAERFINTLRAGFESSAVGALLGAATARGLDTAVGTLQSAGAELLTGGAAVEGSGCRFQNTLLRSSGGAFLADPEGLQTEAFGNSNLIVVADDEHQMERIAESLEGNLTGCIYSHTGSDDDVLYERIAAPLRRRVGRLLNDKMPTGVAVTPAMNHGGPYPATGHPGFTAVGIPASLSRFAMLECYDNVRQHRLPPVLRDANPESVWRRVDGEWTRNSIAEA